MLRNLVVLILGSALLSMTVAGQGSSDEEKVTLPDPVMQQVVSRILRWQFKPASRPKAVPISERGITREWLPSIQNISFQLASDNDALKFKKGVFLFEGLQRIGKHYSINVGWGDFECNAWGDVWKFRIEKDDAVRLWRVRDQWWGRGCGGNGPPKIRGLQVGELSPNELRGFQFFAKGKLNGLKLGISTKEDVERIFGDSCEIECDYDENWSIWAGYFGGDSTITETTADEMGAEVKYEYSPKAAYVGKLQVIHLTPKKRMPLQKKTFSGVFMQNESFSVGDDWNEDGFAGAVHSTSKTYTDGYGLRYSVFEKETFNNLKSKPKKTSADTRTGDLTQIEYSIPDTLRDIIYRKQK